jgi:hypothetical protein
MFPTPTATPLPNGVLINEFLPKPGSDWNGDGRIDVGDEFIELLNIGSMAVDLGGWILDDAIRGGSRPYVIRPGVMLNPGEKLVFFHSDTGISLNDGGDEVWLLAPNGRKMDGTVYTRTRWPDSAWNRYPDGEGVLRLGFPPTPGEANRLPPDLLNPVKKPILPVEGWREVDCGEGGGPILVGDGILTTGGEESALMAESYGWIYTEGGECFAWAAPRFYGGDFVGGGSPGDSSEGRGIGSWWEWWFIR